MPDTFFIGDHKQMFPHLGERIIMATEVDGGDPAGIPADNVAVINAVDKTPLLEKAEIKSIKQTEKAGKNKETEVEVKVRVMYYHNSKVLNQNQAARWSSMT